jgi:hypothetical protein
LIPCYYSNKIIFRDVVLQKIKLTGSENDGVEINKDSNLLMNY